MKDSNGESDDDWRLIGQERFLYGVRLYWSKYSRRSETSDHDHCEFCGAKFMVEDYPGVLHEGYATEDRYRWVCRECYQDFKERFQWEEVGDRAADQ
jgi:hypothetical protein